MNANKLSLVLLLTFVGGMAAAAVRYDPSNGQQQAVRDGEERPIPRVVVVAKRSPLAAEDCETATPRIVVTAQRQKAG